MIRPRPTRDQVFQLRAVVDALEAPAALPYPAPHAAAWWGHPQGRVSIDSYGIKALYVRTWVWARFCKVDPVEALAIRGYGVEFRGARGQPYKERAGGWMFSLDKDARLAELLAESGLTIPTFDQDSAALTSQQVAA